MFEVRVTDRFKAWYEDLPVPERKSVQVRVDLLEQDGPALGRPTVDTVRQSRYANMKELRVSTKGSHIRVLFMFDPLRNAILLLGGSKTGRWSGWYDEMLPIADKLMDEYLAEITDEIKEARGG